MEYTINKLAGLSGVSTRTLRYYDRIGLLPPSGLLPNGYRIYRDREVDLLQQILFYRELEMPLDEIRRILSDPAYDPDTALASHLISLRAQEKRIGTLITTLEKTLSAQKGGTIMQDNEKFEGFKKDLIRENEEKYGAEIRARFGDETIDASNRKVMNMTRTDYEDTKTLEARLNEAIRKAFETGDPRGPLAMEAAALHREWLMRYWTEYSPEAHKGLAEGYVSDPRFTAYYDKIAPGCAVFLRDAIAAYVGSGEGK